MDVFTDEQIKALTVGSWIHQSPTETAQEQMKVYKDFFEVEDAEVNPYFNGPSYLWKLLEVIDPDHMHMVENVKKELASLNVQDFSHSIIKMMAHWNNLRLCTSQHGATYNVDQQYLNFWKSVRMMKEKKFCRMC